MFMCASLFQILSKKTELSIREVERWFFKRRLKDNQTSMKKFRECRYEQLPAYKASCILSATNVVNLNQVEELITLIHKGKIMCNSELRAAYYRC